ncbi:MAG: YHS domain protein [Bacteroidetes bacterium]|nr:YHS domain protein [Bacteroidota bacterium]
MKRILFFFLLTTSFGISSAQIEPVGKDKVALGGYDVVSYFKSNKAIKGTPEISKVLDGVSYYFSSPGNRDLFSRDPKLYLPQYDGYCALAIATQKKKVTINPTCFKITDGKLYLFFNGSLPLVREKFNSLEPWVKDEANLIRTADTNWPKVKGVKRLVK